MIIFFIGKEERFRIFFLVIKGERKICDYLLVKWEGNFFVLNIYTRRQMEDDLDLI